MSVKLSNLLEKSPHNIIIARKVLEQKSLNQAIKTSQAQQRIRIIDILTACASGSFCSIKTRLGHKNTICGSGRPRNGLDIIQLVNKIALAFFQLTNIIKSKSFHIYYLIARTWSLFVSFNFIIYQDESLLLYQSHFLYFSTAFRILSRSS